MFRVWNTRTDKEIEGALIDGEGNVYLEGLTGYEKVESKNLRVDLKVFGWADNEGVPLFENDLLEIENEAEFKPIKRAILNTDGVMLLGVNHSEGAIPLKYFQGRIKKVGVRK